MDGTLAVTGSGKINISTGAVFGNGGTFTGNVVSGGIFNVGDAIKQAGKLAITGTYTQSASGILPIDIGGTTAGTQFDQLNISGAATLGGTLSLDLINGFTPTVGTTYDIMNFGSETGTFATVTGTHINPTEHFQVIVSPTNVMLDVAPGPMIVPYDVRFASNVGGGIFLVPRPHPSRQACFFGAAPPDCCDPVSHTLKDSIGQSQVFENEIKCGSVAGSVGKRAMEKDASWKSPKAGLSHSAWKSRKPGWISTFTTARLRLINFQNQPRKKNS